MLIILFPFVRPFVHRMRNPGTDILPKGDKQFWISVAIFFIIGTLVRKLPLILGLEML